MVECDLAKVEVAGSNPVSRSRYPALALASSLVREGFWHNYPCSARSPSGKAEVCKTSIGGSIPPRASSLANAAPQFPGPSLRFGISPRPSKSSRQHSAINFPHRPAINGSNILL